MRLAGRATLIATFLALSGAAAAGPLEDAHAAYRRGDYATALQLWRPLANQGVAKAQYGLGFLYAKGQGMAQNWAEAVKWFRKAADQGFADAQAGLGVMYANGQGVAQDYAEAAKWFRKAADQGNAFAQSNLAAMQLKGVAQNYVQERKPNAAAARPLEDAEAAYQRGDYAMAYPLTRPLADQGDAVAQSNIGVMYFNGQGVAQDYAEAVRLFRLAADQGGPAGQRGLGVMYDHGYGVAQDYAEAARWYSLAANQGDAIAQFNLGVLYASGQGVAQSYVQAHMWFNLAAAQGDVNAISYGDNLAAKMTPAQIDEAQRLAAEWKATK